MAEPRRVLYLQTEDWAFLLHRLPMSRAAREAGFEVHVATRVGERRAEIEAEGFTVHAIDWTRGSRSVLDTGRAVRQVRQIIRTVRPDILHNVAVKPTLVGGIASLGLRDLRVVNNIAGLGSAFLATAPHKRMLAAGLGRTLRLLMNRPSMRTIVQNPDDRDFLQRLGVRPDQIVLIAGSGVDTHALQPLPEPEGRMTLAFVGRMLEDKGVRALVAAHSLLAETGEAPLLLLAGTPDPQNPTTIPEAELENWGRRADLEWLGQVTDIPGLWLRAHIAVLPSRREGLPKSLLEAAALGRPMIASDAPGCREIAVEGVSALTHPIDDAVAIADAIRRMAGDQDIRLRFGAAARQLVEERFSNDIIGAQTVALYESMLA
jgi:glycosyltransferase involved in cell wall biosynthesis